MFKFTSRAAFVLSLLALGQEAAATTVFATDPSGCQIIGDADVYGIGIRIGLYLQWASVILAYLISPSSGTSIRTASNTLYFAVLINTLYCALTKPDNILVLEWFLARLLTFWLLLYNLPVSSYQYFSQLGSLTVMCILSYTSAIVDLWIYWKRLDQGQKDGCSVQLFVFKSFDSNNTAWVGYSRAMGIIFCIGLPGLIYSLIVFAISGLSIDPDNVLESANVQVDDDEKEPSAAARGGGAFLIGVCGIVTIVFLEKTLQANDIMFEDFDILSSGQLIPMMIGVGSVIGVLWNSARRCVSRMSD